MKCQNIWRVAAVLFALHLSLLTIPAGAQDFDPTLPGNPGANNWDKASGYLIVDDFQPGQLELALNRAIGSYTHKDEIISLTVAGQMNGNEVWSGGAFPNMVILDLSRTTGMTEIGRYSYENTKLESVLLPHTVEKIGFRAFYNTPLTSFSIYAMTPPTLENEVFKNVPEGLVVYVPAAAIPLYSEAEGWKDYTILPIQEDIRNLTVALPEGTVGADYAQMWLELTNTKSGQRLHYVMTDRQAYTFPNIIRQTEWNVTLRNERGDVFGQINKVAMGDEDVTVTFAKLTKPLGVTLKVTTPDGQDVTSQVQATWTDAAGNYVGQGTKLTGLPEGMNLVCSMSLSQDLTMTYAQPYPIDFELNALNKSLTSHLLPLTSTSLTGRVKDAQTGLPIEGAAVSASQTFGGRYTKTVSATTAADGSYKLEVACVPTTLGITAADYVSQTVTCGEMLEESSQTVMGDVRLRPVTGATITLGFTYTPCPEGDEQPKAENYYADWQNVDYTLYNVTRAKPVSQFHVQYPQIVLMEEVADGDVLSLRATSRSNGFMPVETEVTIADQQAKATIAVSELGKLRATFAKTGNATVTGSLYDGTGRLLTTADYVDANLTFNGLQDGTYTLVTMGKSQLFNTIYELTQLPQTKLVEGTDYVTEQVRVVSGRVTQVNMAEVPTLDESKLYYTGEGTSFTVNKPSIVVGNYLTLTARLDFQPDYAEQVSQVEVAFDLPEGCQFVENSVMVGNATSAYTLNGRRLTVPLTNYWERVRFCVVPTVGGDYSPNAFAQFTLDGAAILQPIGTATFTANDLSIVVPSTVNSASINVSGQAIGASSVNIYDGDVLIGQTHSRADGSWSATCQLNQPANLSRHFIYAKMTTSHGFELTSETGECVHDKEAIQVKKVNMYHYNQEIGFDFLNPSEKEEKYTVAQYDRNFTFTVDFTANDTALIDNVVVFAEGADGNHYPFDAAYDEKQGLWVATGQLGNSELPVNVSVDYTLKTPVKMDISLVKQLFNDTTDFDEDVDFSRRADALMAEIDAFDEKDLAERYGDLLSRWMALNEELYSEDDLRELQQFKDSVDRLSEAEIEALLDQSLERDFPDDFELGGSTDYNRYYDFTAGDYHYIYRSCEGMTAKDIPTDFMTIPTTDDHDVYVYNSTNRIAYIDLVNDIYYEVTHTPAAQARRRVDGENIEVAWSYESAIIDHGIIKKAMIESGKRATDANLQLQRELYLAAKAKGKNYRLWAKHIRKAKQLDKTFNRCYKLTKRLSKVGKVAKFAPFVDAGINAYHAYDKISTVSEITKTTIDCKSKAVQDSIKAYESDARWMKAEAVGYHTANFAVGTGAGAAIAALGVACPVSLFFTVPAACLVNFIADSWYDTRFERKTDELRKRYEKLKRDCEEKEKQKKKKSKKGGKYRSGNRNKKFYIDPSGYVYEAVHSNRLEGVTATIYYKETVEDMYGDLSENIVKWDAAEYAQENPLFTDQDGCYQWDVPQGLWQVVFEKPGYETTQSEWLPVPPPQLDVNIGMRQQVQPVVSNARAYEQAVTVEFDKYMMTDLLTPENIRVADDNGTPVEGTILLLNEEESCASKVRFEAVKPFSGKEVALTVSNRVKSYAGIRMQDDFCQTFVVEQELRQLLCDSVVSVDYGQTATMAVTVLPVSASAGKTLRVSSSSPMIVGIGSESIVLNEQGSALITLDGRLPGTSTVRFTVDGSDLTATTTVNVVEQLFQVTATPTASIASGAVVDAGTKVTLSCQTEGATIWYTLDGSCPCDETAARLVYDSTPITLDRSVTIRTMAAAPGMDESQVASFIYTVLVPEGMGNTPTAASGNNLRYNLGGHRVDQTYKGVVITDGQTVITK